MKIKSRLLAATLSVVAAVPLFAVTGCKKAADLRIYNCYDYIDEALIAKFTKEYKAKTGKKIKVEYSCFDTPEDCYNALKIDGTAYDLVCPSDYMIEKMAREDMLEEITLSKDGGYMKNVSPFIKNKFEEISFSGKSLANYAAGYMWGTLGLVYDVNGKTVTADDMKSWSVLWNDSLKNKFTIKDSVRDTYFIGLAKYYKNDLENAKSAYAGGGTLADYQTALKSKFNDTAESTVSGVEKILKDLKARSKGMEVDSGKDDILKGDIDVYFAWSGDAVYAMDEGAGNSVKKYLDYVVPEEGSNVWFDGWCVPKGAKNKELALEFIDFISAPENAIANMEYIGYVSCIAGSDVYNWVKETYAVADGGNVKAEAETVDLSYFFGAGDYGVTSNVRQFFAQYPKKEIVDRCVVMNYYPDEANSRINNMWSRIKTA